jgi:large subunit ribosomal protein L13
MGAVLGLSGDDTVYIDATEQIAGRLASKVAKLIISGKRVVVINAEKALVSGSRTSVINQWKERLELASKVNPIYGPIHPRRPDNILRRMVRGMVPRKKPKGAAAMKRLRVYIGVPSDVKAPKMAKFEDTAATRPVPVYVSMGDLSKSLGWNE